jgi:hypothetical protein
MRCSGALSHRTLPSSLFRRGAKSESERSAGQGLFLGAAFCDDPACNLHGAKDADENLLYWQKPVSPESPISANAETARISESLPDEGTASNHHDRTVCGCCPLPESGRVIHFRELGFWYHKRRLRSFLFANPPAPKTPAEMDNDAGQQERDDFWRYGAR